MRNRAKMRALRRVLLGALLKCATADVRRRNQSPLSLPRRHALSLRGGTATASAPTGTTPATTPPKKKHAYITPRELTQIMVADLAPHGMLPLAWAATRGAGTGVVPALMLLAVFASSSAYTLYLAAQLAEAGREARRAAPALSELSLNEGIAQLERKVRELAAVAPPLLGGRPRPGSRSSNGSSAASSPRPASARRRSNSPRRPSRLAVASRSPSPTPRDAASPTATRRRPKSAAKKPAVLKDESGAHPYFA